MKLEFADSYNDFIVDENLIKCLPDLDYFPTEVRLDEFEKYFSYLLLLFFFLQKYISR